MMVGTARTLEQRATKEALPISPRSSHRHSQRAGSEPCGCSKARCVLALETEEPRSSASARGMMLTGVGDCHAKAPLPPLQAHLGDPHCRRRNALATAPGRLCARDLTSGARAPLGTTSEAGAIVPSEAKMKGAMMDHHAADRRVAPNEALPEHHRSLGEGFYQGGSACHESDHTNATSDGAAAGGLKKQALLKRHGGIGDQHCRRRSLPTAAPRGLGHSSDLGLL